MLALATRALPSARSGAVSDETGMVLEGLLVFADPVKPDAAATIDDFAAAGVSIRMITGDARPAAAHIGDLLGLQTGTVLTGAQINALADDALAAADVGISVRGAADVAADAASIVMLENDLAALLDGMRQGRRTFANTMTYIFMTTSANFGNVISMAIASVILPFLPLLASQILLINLLTDLPATAIATDRVDRDQLARPQKWDMRLIRDYMIVFGLVSSAFDLITFAVLRIGYGAGEAEFQSAWFLGSILTEVFVLFVLRTRGPAWRSRPSGILVWLSLGVVVVTFALVLTPAGGVIHLTVLPLPLLGLIVVIALLYCVATELTKVVFWRSRRRALRSGSARA